MWEFIFNKSYGVLKNSTLEKMTNKTCQKIKVSHDFGSKSQKVGRKDDNVCVRCSLKYS